MVILKDGFDKNVVLQNKHKINNRPPTARIGNIFPSSGPRIVRSKAYL